MPGADVSAAGQVAASTPMGWLARVGLGARAAVYLLMGWLAVVVATGGQAHVDQRGAITSVLDKPLGGLLVLLLAAGFGAYAVWRFSEAAFGIVGAKDGLGPRATSFIRGIAYSIFAIGAVSVLLGSRESQSRQQESLATSAIHLPGGRLLLGLLGAAFLVAGLLMIREGLTTAFLKYFDYLPQPRRSAVVWLGRVGTVTRGGVFSIAGVLVVLAAWWADPSKAGGINEIVQTALDRPFGGGLVALMGAGLLLFGLYGVAETLWRRVPDGDPTS